ncbi:hypothetical protein NKW43_14060 [Gluconobacter albidus]|uniref:terminase small subunit-like protein n=1 Tax=Gluconobacter albidus TaxID=318683 RepID=UPI00209DC486|nr:hypothetical protein [Gluconobacter albidus]MCP1274792.1 hypothetical protein [Gluconobacter albidus]
MARKKGEVIPAKPKYAPRTPITPEVWDEVLELIEQGHTIRDISAMVDMPDWTTIRRYIRSDDERSTQYARARACAADAYEAEILEAARSANPETASAAKVKIDTLKWVMSKRAPKVYGDKITQEHTGADGGPLEFTEIRRVVVDVPKKD